jgi:hypothetical protein
LDFYGKMAKNTFYTEGSFFFEKLLGYWVIGLLGYWVIGLLGYWVIGLLGYWVIRLLGY